MKFIIAIALPPLFSGCTTGLAMMAMNGFGACSPQDFKTSQYLASQIQTIQAGESESAVIARMGKPEKKKKIRTKEGLLAHVLFFRTNSEHCRNYGDEKIPVITKNGRVQGVGDAYYQSIRLARHP